jgi:hypothetical protein
MKNLFLLTCIICVMLGNITTAAAQTGTTTTEGETITHTFDVVEQTDEEIERRLRLSEKYIKSTITPDELEELKSLKANFANLDGYKAEYEAGRGDSTSSNNGQNSDVNPNQNAQMPAMNHDVSMENVQNQSKIMKVLNALAPLAFPLAAINTLLILLLAIDKKKPLV